LRERRLSLDSAPETEREDVAELLDARVLSGGGCSKAELPEAEPYSLTGLGLFLRMYCDERRLPAPSADEARVGVEGALRSGRRRAARAALMPASPALCGERSAWLPREAEPACEMKADDVGVWLAPSESALLGLRVPCGSCEAGDRAPSREPDSPAWSSSSSPSLCAPRWSSWWFSDSKSAPLCETKCDMPARSAGRRGLATGRGGTGSRGGGRAVAQQAQDEMRGAQRRGG
jgi:hypothetical protein